MNSEANYCGSREESAGDHVENMTPVPVDPQDLGEKIKVLESQIAVLEEGLARAPGMERAALAEEICEYREQLDAAKRALESSGGSLSCYRDLPE